MQKAFTVLLHFVSNLLVFLFFWGGGVVFCFCWVFFVFFYSKICRNPWSFYPLAESQAELFNIDAHVLLNKRLGLQYLLYESSKIFSFSGKFRVFSFTKSNFCKVHTLNLQENSFKLREYCHFMQFAQNELHCLFKGFFPPILKIIFKSN